MVMYSDHQKDFFYKKITRHVLGTLWDLRIFNVTLVKGSLSIWCLTVFGYFCDADAEFRNTGLERAGNLTKDLAWFKEEGHSIPEPLSPGIDYSLYIEELSKKDPQAFICHFYNTYFAHTAGGRMIGRKVRLHTYMHIWSKTWTKPFILMFDSCFLFFIIWLGICEDLKWKRIGVLQMGWWSATTIAEC